jgi:fused signal recognition particle receptor
MFDKLKSAFTSLKQLATHSSLSREEIDSILSEFELALMESDVAQEVVDGITTDLRTALSGAKVARSDDKAAYVRSQLKEAIRKRFASTQKVDLVSQISAKLRESKNGFSPFVILFLGINGTGKTTTVARLAYMLKNMKFSVVVAAGDTHRAGAIEQLAEHANRLNIKCIAQSYGSDPAAVAKDAELYAESHRIGVVLIDSAGRIQTSKNLMDEMGKIVRVVRPDLKIFVGDSLAGNDAVSQAKEFRSFTDFDAAILTKADADVKGGAALSITYITGKPIIYLGVGQEYKDLIPFDAEKFIESIIES